jgi:acyl-CoA thioesterase
MVVLSLSCWIVRVYCLLFIRIAWFAIAVLKGKGTMLTTADLTVHYLKPAVNTDLTCIGKVMKNSKGTCVGQAELHDERGNLIAVGIATLVVFGESYNEQNYLEKMAIKVGSKL